MSGIIFDHQKEIEAKIEINHLKMLIRDYEEEVKFQKLHIKQLSDFIDETNDLIKKELDIVRSE